MAAARVLYFVGSFEQGGSERQIAELISGLPRDRFEAHLAVCNATDHLGYELPVASRTFLDAPNGPTPRALVRLVRLVRSLRPDIVHAVHDPQNAYARLAVTVAGRGKAIGSLRCTKLPMRTLRRERLTARLGAALIVNSRGIHEELACAGLHSLVVHNGVDAARFRPLEGDDRAQARERFGMDGPTVVVPARIARQKNQLAIVRAVARLARRGAWPVGARVLLAGRSEAHSRYGLLVTTAIRLLGVERLVVCMAPVRDAERLLAAADAVLLPSHYEGLPNAVLEALACGTPVIVSPEANADVLVEQGAGIVLGDASIREIERGLVWLFATPEARLAARARRASLVARFSRERMVDETCAIYDRVLGVG